MNSPEVQEIVYAAAAGLCAFAGLLFLGSVYSDYVLERRAMPRRQEGGGPKGSSFMFRAMRPFARFFGHLVSSAAARLQERFGEGGPAGHLMRLRLRLQRTLTAAGSPEGLSADEMLGLVCFSVLAWGALGALLGLALGSSLPVPVALLVGAAQPLMWLRRTLERRRRSIRKLLPFALDLLTLSVEAGLDFSSALARLVPKLGSAPLAFELRQMLRDMRLGKSRPDALRELADRLHMPEVAGFTGSMIQAEELGADLGPVLRVQAEQMRNDRSNRAEKKAMEAPVKILFPLIAFIFPTVFLILFGGIGMRYLARIFGL